MRAAKSNPASVNGTRRPLALAGPGRGVYHRPVRSTARASRARVRVVRRSTNRACGTSSVLRETTQRVSDGLLQRVGRGDAQAVRECLTRYTGLVWSLARRLTYTAAEAEDAVQEIFVEIWKNAGKYDPAIASETAFVAMIARRRLIDRKRRNERRLDRQTLPETVPGQDDQNFERPGLSEDARRAVDAMKSLTPDQQRVLRLSIMHGLSHEKIATSTGLPMGTVKTHARRGLIRLRELLKVGASGNGDSLDPATQGTEPREATP